MNYTEKQEAFWQHRQNPPPLTAREFWRAAKTLPQKRKQIVLPFYGEAGWFVLKHIRTCYQLRKEHIICCNRGEEFFFPRASGFFYDWQNPLEDCERANIGGFASVLWKTNNADKELLGRLKSIYGDEWGITRPSYPNSWTMSGVKFPLVVPHYLSADIVIAPRYRKVGTERNFQHWQQVVGCLVAAGYSVGTAGNEECSVKIDAPTPLAWEHPNGTWSGCVDLLQHCKYFIGTDSAISHLAAFMDVPSSIFWQPGGGNMAGHIRQTNPNAVLLGSDYWEQPEEIAQSVLRTDCASHH